MSKRSSAAYYAQLERVYSYCAICRTIGARFAKDGRRLCKKCRQELVRKGQPA